MLQSSPSLSPVCSHGMLKIWMVLGDSLSNEWPMPVNAVFGGISSLQGWGYGLLIALTELYRRLIVPPRFARWPEKTLLPGGGAGVCVFSPGFEGLFQNFGGFSECVLQTKPILAIIKRRKEAVFSTSKNTNPTDDSKNKKQIYYICTRPLFLV